MVPFGMEPLLGYDLAIIVRWQQYMVNKLIIYRKNYVNVFRVFFGQVYARKIYIYRINYRKFIIIVSSDQWFSRSSI